MMQPTVNQKKNDILKDFVAVKQSTFMARYQATWDKFDELCLELGVEVQQIQQLNQQKSVYQWQIYQKNLNKNHRKKAKKTASYPMVRLYRQICQHYALAKQRHYSPQLVAQLQQRVMIGHRLIYQNKTNFVNKFLTFILYEFPARLRQHQKLFWISFCLFYVPFFLMMIGCYLNNELIYSVMSPMQVANMEYMYDPSNRQIGRTMERQADSDIMMFGLYVYNNIGIDFQMYATGIFFGIGTIISTLYNGVVIGAVAGHLTQLGYSETFWSFVCGHSSFELMGAVIASCAGLRLAQAVVAPFPHSRKDAFIVAGKQSIQILLGASFMTFIAAFIEAFWSSSSLIPNTVKYVVALLFWAMVIGYLAFAGRGYVLDDIEQSAVVKDEIR